MFGKVMRWSDGMIASGFTLCTTVPETEIKEITAAKNPRDAKLRLAYEITKTFLGEAAAEQGKKRFEEVIQNKEVPAEIPEITPTAYDIVTVLTQGKLVKSKSEARQVVAQGGVKINDQKVEAIDVVVKAGDVVQKGNRFFVKVK
jgi:tyrosyl-tRNA synthetase